MSASSVVIRDIVVATGLWPRRRLRKMRDLASTPAGDLPVDARIELDSDWTELAFASVPMRARVTLAPVFVLHKPTGCVTARRGAPGQVTVFEFLDDPLAQACEPVGRLDIDTTGVLLFAADGQLVHRLTHPKREVVRTYVAELEQALPAGAAEQLLGGGVTLDDGHVPHPTRLVTDADVPTRVDVDLTAGKYHEVRRMFAAVGAPVVALHRRTYADVAVEDLLAGESRRLGEDEVRALCQGVSWDPPADFLEVEVLDG